MAYEGSIELISGIRTKNNGKFPLVNAPDVRIDDGTRLSDFVGQKGHPNGYASLDDSGRVPSDQLPLIIGEELLEMEYIPDTVQSVEFDQDGRVERILHINQNGSEIVRTDTFSFDAVYVTEIREVTSGASLTIEYDSQNMTTTATYASA